MTTTRELLSRLQTSSLQIPLVADVLALLPDAALLVHRANQRILAANAAALALSAHPEKRLLRLSLPELLEDFDLWNSLEDGGGERIRQHFLRMGNGSRRLVRVVCHPLGEHTHWVVVRLHKAVQHPHTAPVSPLQWENRFIETVERITRLLETRSEQESLWEHLLRAVQTLTEARLMALYRAESAASQVQRIAVLPADTPLPETLNAQELAMLRVPSLWQAGEAPRNGLQRLAHRRGLRYLASVPLGEGAALTGLLVAADPERRPSPRLSLALHTMSKMLYLIVRQRSLRRNLQRQVQEAAESLALHRALAEYIPLGALFLDAGGRIQWMNPAAESMLGYAMHEVQNWPAQDVIIGADNFSRLLEQAMHGDIIHSLGHKSELHHRNGSPFPAKVQIIPIPAPHAPAIERLLLLIEDISQREAIENRNRQLAQRALLGEVTSIFAHEVRNPINNIQMGLQLLAASLPDDPTTQDTLRRMKEDAERLTHLMDSVLTFSRSNTLKQMHPLDLGSLLDGLLSRWQPRLARQGVRHRLSAPRPLPKILGHAPSLEQVFNNLFSNALRAMPEGGDLVIKISRHRDRQQRVILRVDVADTGSGIPPEIQEHIFAPFFTTDERKGTGLGLAITQQIVTNHKGSIQVQSYPGGGTIFRLYFPALGEAAPPPAPPERNPAS